MTRYMRENGQETTIDDDQRLVWYGVGGYCGFWTDDMSKVKFSVAGGGLVCPKCGCSGKTCTIRQWINGAVKIESDVKLNAPWYLKFLLHHKETCRTHLRLKLKAHYASWVTKEHHKRRQQLPGE